MNLDVTHTDLVRPKVILIGLEFAFDSGVVLDRGGSLSEQFEGENALNLNTSNRRNDLEVRLFPHPRIPLDHTFDRPQLVAHVRQSVIECFGDDVIKQDRGNARAVDPKALETFPDPSDELPQVANKTGAVGIDACGPVPDLPQERNERISDAASVLAVVSERDR